jgi:hypothetical protein
MILLFAFSDDVDDVFGAKVRAVAILASDDEGIVAQLPDIPIADATCDFDPYSLAGDTVSRVCSEDHLGEVAWLQAVAICFVWYPKLLRILSMTFFC